MALLELIQRKVYFFRLADFAEFVPKMEAAIKVVDGLPWNDQGRYQPQASGDTVLALFVTSPSFPLKLQFARIRRDNLPVVERAGDLTPLELSDEEGLMDSCHLVIFPDGIVAAEFNHDGPRIRRLGPYLAFKSGNTLPSAPRFLPLFQKDVLAELDNFPDVTLLEVEAKATEADLVAEGDKHIGKALAACRDAGATKKARLELRSGAHSPLRDLARRLFRGPGREALTKLKVSGGIGRRKKSLDMLEEYLVSMEGFERVDPRSKAISSQHAFEVLETAYEARKNTFASAAVASDDIW